VDEEPETRAELARRHGVHASAITRALQAARQAHADDATQPAPPQPLNPAGSHQMWLPSMFDPWWANRRLRGRPRTDHSSATAKPEKTNDNCY